MIMGLDEDSEPDGPEEYLSEGEEARAFAELNRLAEELKGIDPAAFGGYEGFSGHGSWTAGSTDLDLTEPGPNVPGVRGCQVDHRLR
ncbi:hypothetical protein [Streptomyces sp. NPDC002057]|uniref:hypothetical protein n=1 Tax=Streptomyces sp. NPDC002057 TaxID=3154664 RepID=UPI003331C3B7